MIANVSTPNVLIAHQNRKAKLNHICPFYGYKVPCIYELKNGECKALHLEAVREIFEEQRKHYNETKEAIEEETVIEMIKEK